MPRLPREEAANATHHVVAKGNAGGHITLDDNDRNNLFVRLGRAATRCHWSCLAYCLMDTHIHIIVRTPEPNLGYGMQRFLSPYAEHFNRRYLREGHVFRGRFYSQRIASTEHLVAALIYVLLNPVKAGMVRRPDLWRWSSCASTLGLAVPPGFLDVGGALELFGADQQSARGRLEQVIRDASELEGNSLRA